MKFEIINISIPVIVKQAAEKILKCNEYTAQYGFTLTASDAAALVATRTSALKSCGRIELGSGIIEKIIKAFSDSPYISNHNYVETLHELVEMFYAYKNETLDLVSDDDLIGFMKNRYNGVCQGSLELLNGRELAKLAHDLRSGSSNPERVMGRKNYDHES